MSARTRSRTPRILVVDDEPANRKLLADLVLREDCEVITAAGGAEALEILARESVDLVLLDIMMPGVNGLTVLAELQKRGKLPRLPVVVITASEERWIRIDSLAAGAIDFLTKPIDRLEVSCKIRTLVELKQLRDRELATVESALLESDHLRRLGFEQSPTATIDWDPDFRVVGWNAAAERLFGYSREEALGRHVAFIVPAPHWPHIEAIQSDLLAGKPNESTLENLARDGRSIVCEWHSAPLTSTAGRVLGSSSVVLDLTERRRLQDALIQAQKMDAIGRLAGGVAHDFNNILSVILSFSTFVRDRLPDGDERKDDIVEVLKAAERGIDLTRQLLTFSHQPAVAKRPTDINDRIAQLHRILARTLGEHIELVITLSPQPASVNIDPIQFDQIILNLAANARDAMPEGGMLFISVDQAVPDAGAANVQVVVRDTGFGIDSSLLQQIFQPFFTTKESGKGTGLGLAICHTIARDAGGSLRIDSIPGNGTTVTLTLPRCADAVEPAVRKASVFSTGNGELVLVAEDEPALRRVATRALESAQFKVVTAADGREAIARIDELGESIAVIVSDVIMPGSSGYDVAAHAARVTPGTSVLLTSGYVNEVSRHRNRLDLPILWKPVPPADLVRAVSEKLAGRHERRAVPVTQPAAVASIVPAGRALPAGTAHILAIEDNELIALVNERVLGDAGFTISVAHSLATARELLQTQQFDALLVDLGLPDGSGLDLLRELRQRDTTLPIVIATGDPTVAMMREVEDEACEYLVKPYSPADLVNMMRKAVEYGLRK